MKWPGVLGVWVLQRLKRVEQSPELESFRVERSEEMSDGERLSLGSWV